jgi:hypothetical protein
MRVRDLDDYVAKCFHWSPIVECCHRISVYIDQIPTDRIGTRPEPPGPSFMASRLCKAMSSERPYEDPADLGEDLVYGGGPHERLRVGVPVFDLVADLLHEGVDRGDRLAQRKHHRPAGRVQVQTDHVGDLVREGRIA